ncbi:hypothetical protein LB523_12040 [Mesorhizobium sp. ESP-6-4]|uniref:hypothetical protein n=1 Tax=Mesorhizobium sp. ESP-6-4 TaxID=2876624 RepID=UPI001CCD4C2A|nr:hypothetical protein [Mesorhizobium sp. ESP-6-4]MBZ9659776.1 hypothetical protein [Mesorhizobium sp. ESP-6-4]
MPTGFEFFDRDLRLATAGLEPAQVNTALAKFAKQELARAISEGASTKYDRYVNGRQGASEESVVAPGPIVYVFSNWPLVINAALEELKKRAPRKSGRYVGSFVVVVGGRTVVTDFSKLRADAEVVIFSQMPYTRKIEAGYNGPGKRHFDLSKSALNSRFRGAFEFEMKYVDVPGGISPSVPYHLKRTTKRRSAGTPLTYPALIINAAP